MHKEYAIQILETVERGKLERDCRLAKEAFRYLKRLKITQDIYERIYKIEHK